MRKVQMKQMTKRVLSVLMVLCMVFAMIPAENILAAAKRVVENKKTVGAEEVTVDITTSEFNSLNNNKSLTRERKILNEVEPDDFIMNVGTAENPIAKGTTENPFLIVEVVADPDYASIGYLVDGCEPVDMDLLRGNKMAIKDLTGSENGGDFFGFGTWKKASGSLFFFEDEKEGDRLFYQNTNVTNKKKDASEGGIEIGQSKYASEPDEWDAKEKTDNKRIYGYYEAVKKGTGTFILKQDAIVDADGNPVLDEEGRPTFDRDIVKADKANLAEVAETTLVWHTTNDYVIDQYKAEGLYSDYLFLSLENLDSETYFPRLKIDVDAHPEYVGNRFYTYRDASTSDPYVDVTGCLYYYESNDLFVTETLGKSKKDAAKYSIAVKTLTAKELNENPEWIQKADLIYFNCDLDLTTEVDEETSASLLTLWQSKKADNKYMNRFQVAKKTGTTMGFKGTNREISGNVVYDIVKSVTQKDTTSDRHLALIIDQNCIKASNLDTKTGVKYKMYKLGVDNSFKITRTSLGGSTYGATGYKNNIAKLWLACTSANPGYVKKFFFDGGMDAAGGSTNTEPDKRQIKDDGGVLVFKSLSGDEKTWWSGMSFYCAEERYYGKNAKDFKDEYWFNYAGDTNHATFNGTSWVDDDRYYVQGRVFVTPDGISLVDGYAEAYSSSALSFATSKYEDFNDFLTDHENATYKANEASASDATKYILDMDGYMNYYFDNVKVLDVEPSVAMYRNSNGKSDYKWLLTNFDVIKLIPKRIGSDTKINEIAHMVMQTFVAKNEDLNSAYDLIYLGDDAGGLWTGEDLESLGWVKTTTTGNWWNQTTVYGYTAGKNRTDFVDDNMDGWVYFHIGDTLKIDSNTGGAPLGNNDKDETRQAGNDLTNKKKDQLEDYIDADYPIVVADNLWPHTTNADAIAHRYVDNTPQCVINKFLTEFDPENHKDASGNYSGCYYTKDMLGQIDKMVKNRLKGRVTINAMHKIYDSNSTNDTYLETNALGYASLKFEVKVPNTTEFQYRVFIDRNRDANFTYDSTNDDNNEVITNGYISLNRLNNTFDVPVPDKWVGFLQWRIEVVSKYNESKRYSLEGCSAVKALEGADSSDDRAKKKIIALQIMPTHNHDTTGNNGGDYWKPSAAVDLANKPQNGKNHDERMLSNTTWQNLYDQVNDFDIEVVKITWKQFMQLFKGEGFTFNMGKAIDVSATGNNPNGTVLSKIESKKIAFGDSLTGTLNTNPANSDDYYSLSDFNMIVLGFDDGYGMTDMSNYYGAVEYLYYFAQKGCSILFTHDTTSQNGNPYRRDNNNPYQAKRDNAAYFSWADITTGDLEEYEKRPFGYTGNTMMREIMGMNRYMKYSNYLDTDTGITGFSSTLKTNIKNYVKDIGKISYDNGYDSTAQKGLQGYSIYNLTRYVGATTANNGKNGRIQWKYITVDPNGSTKYTSGYSGGTWTNGGDPNTLTTVVTRVNEGQITQYPFTINSMSLTSGANQKYQFKVGQTHGQWWQLNMEDKDLTVWYTLDDPAMSYSIDPNTDRSSVGKNRLIYSAVPQDAANNYYIYSKGNIFYTGVGHSKITSSDTDQKEYKLFVNTLVAAYRPKFGLPFIQVTSNQATLIKNSPRTYGITLPVDYNYTFDADGNLVRTDTEVLLGDGGLNSFYYQGNMYVEFVAKDNNGCATIFTAAHYANASEEHILSQPVAIYSSWANAQSGNAMSTSRNDGTMDYYELEVDKTYWIKYPKSSLSSYTRIIFESYSNRITTAERDKTLIQFNMQPLFKLD